MKPNFHAARNFFELGEKVGSVVTAHGNVKERLSVFLLPRVSVVEEKGLFSLKDDVTVVIRNGHVICCKVKGPGGGGGGGGGTSL